MNRYLVLLSALALTGCIDGTSGDDTSDSDSSTEPEFFSGDPIIWSVSKACSANTWTYTFFTDGLAGGITIDVTEDQSSVNGWDETHVLDIASDDIHWDGQGSPTGTTTNADAAGMDPDDDADSDNRPDFGSGAEDFDGQPFDDADGLVGSWDHWNTTQPVVATIGDVSESGANQTSLLPCADNDGQTLSWKVTMYNDDTTPTAVDCVIFGRRSSAQFGTSCVCIDADGDCSDDNEN